MFTYSAIVFLAVVCLVNADSGKTTRYWDCCKASCSWSGKSKAVAHPVNACQKDGTTVDSNLATKSGCDNGTAFMCSNQQPWSVSDSLSYGFTAASVAGKTEDAICCACYQLTFTSGPVSGKKMIVQVTNTGSDLSSNHFDLQMPGGGVGIFNGCQVQFGAPADGWGQRYGGISSASQCSSLPSVLQSGCNWRFNWFQNADNPSVDFTKVACPSEITSKTGCTRSDG